MAPTLLQEPIPSPSTGFEGPEKRLEIRFSSEDWCPLGLRTYPSTEWQEMLDLASCTILSITKNEHFDAYLLSESSLFVFSNSIVLKTCGTTTLLSCIDHLLLMAARIHSNFQCNYVSYARKNYLFPESQKFPHASFEDEVSFLNERFHGDAYIIGPITADYWNVYVAEEDIDQALPSPIISFAPSHYRTLFEIKMHELSPEVMNEFYTAKNPIGLVDLKEKLKLSQLMPGALIDDFLFNPCGYSVNSLAGPSYYTLHVTPESHCSYVSFETSVPLTPSQYSDLVTRVLAIFLPAKFSLQFIYDNGETEDTMETLAVVFPTFKRTSRSLSTFHHSTRRILTCTYEISSAYSSFKQLRSCSSPVKDHIFSKLKVSLNS